MIKQAAVLSVTTTEMGFNGHIKLPLKSNNGGSIIVAYPGDIVVRVRKSQLQNSFN